MADNILIPPPAATAGGPVPIADIKDVSSLNVSDPMLLRQYSPFGNAGNDYNEHTIVTIPPTQSPKYRIYFDFVSGGAQQYWEFSTSTARDDAYDNIIVEIGVQITT